MSAVLNANRIRRVHLSLMSADFHKDPARVRALENRELEKMAALWEKFKDRLIQDFTAAWNGEDVLHAGPSQFSQAAFDQHTGELLQDMVVAPAGGIIEDAEKTAYSHGIHFAESFFSVQLGADPAIRKLAWERIADRIDQNKMRMVRLSQDTQKEIRKVIGDGIADEREFKDITRDIIGRVDHVGIVRAETMVRSETVRAVNNGVKDRYQEAGVTWYERLEALDEKTCTDWEFNINGEVIMGCAALNGLRFNREEADLVDEQTHPNCRGTWISFIPVPQGEEEQPEPTPEAPIVPPAAIPLKMPPLPEVKIPEATVRVIEPEPLRLDTHTKGVQRPRR